MGWFDCTARASSDIYDCLVLCIIQIDVFNYVITGLRRFSSCTAQIATKGRKFAGLQTTSPDIRLSVAYCSVKQTERMTSLCLFFISVLPSQENRSHLRVEITHTHT